MASIRHIAVFTKDPEELADFYVETFGMKITQPITSSPESGKWVFLTDGYIDLAPADRPYAEDRVHDIHGNPIDLSRTGLRDRA